MQNYSANIITMENSNVMFLKCDGNEQLKCWVTTVYGVNILRIETNFNTYTHKRFAYESVFSIKGVRIVTGIQMDTKESGVYSFILVKGFDFETLKTDLKEKFRSYFTKF